jgi:hypothetical protein
LVVEWERQADGNRDYEIVSADELGDKMDGKRGDEREGIELEEGVEWGGRDDGQR